MKKLLVLILVLVMTSAASATLTLVQQDLTGADLTVNIGGPGGLLDGILTGDMYVVISSDGMLSGYALTASAPDASGFFSDTATIGGLGAPAGFTGEAWALAALQSTYPVSDAVMTVVGENIGDTVAIGWFDESMNAGIIETIVLVPEPMTIALLGLGSLLMLRRRK